MLTGYRAYVANPDDNSVAVLNAMTGTILNRISVGTTPTSVAYSPNGTCVLVSNSGSDTVSLINAINNTVSATIPVGIAPQGIAVNSIGTRAYVANSGAGANTVSVIDIPSHSVIATVSVGTGPLGVAVSPNDLLVYVANEGSDDVTVIDAVTNTVLIPSIPVGTAPRYLTVGADGRVWVPNSGSDNVSVINPVTNTVLATISVGTGPNAVRISPSGALAYVTNIGSDNVSVISTASYGVVATIALPAGANPELLAFDTNPEVGLVRLFVTNSGDNTISIINPNTNAIIATLSNIALTGGPEGIIIGPLGAAESPGDPIDLLDPYVLEEINESVCIIVNKVFASCQQRECFPLVDVEVPIGGNYVFQDIRFFGGTIIPGSLFITPLPDRPNFSRVRLTVSINYTVTLLNTLTGDTISLGGVLPDIEKDIVMFIPPARDEVDLNIIAESRSELVSTPSVAGNILSLAVGVFLVLKVVGQVQLLVPAFGYCPEPVACEDYTEETVDVCEVFNNPTLTPFPSDFFPPQLEDLTC